ncbi:MAG: disulfide bond formation protein B [Burkholderiaceae bacterium]|nr:disulfide bond formation protein B [Burkholderiaceae bacterium]
MVLDLLFAHPRRVFAAIAAICVAMLAFGILYLQNVVGVQPCPMCVVQRYCFVVIALLCVCAACSGKVWAWRFWGLLTVGVACFGAFVAARQSWLQWYPPEFSTCGRDLYGMIASFPLQRVVPMIFQGSGDCSAVDWTFLGGTIANWAFVWFVIFGLVVLGVLLRRRPARGLGVDPL